MTTIVKYGKDEAKAAARRLLQGIITAPCLPFDERGDVSERGLRHDVRHCIDVLQCGGLYINGYYGHFWLLASEQRRQVIEIVVDEAAGAVPVINRCAHSSPREAVALARHFQDPGVVDFISLVISQFGGAHKDIVLGYFAMIAREVDLGIKIFNTRQAGYTLSAELMADLAEIPNVCALKNDLPLEHTDRIRELVGDSIVALDPNEEHLMRNMAEHGQRAIYTGTNMMFDSAAAAPMRDYVQAGLAGRIDDAQKLSARMQPIRDLHHRWVLEPWRESGLCPIATVKYWSSLMGMTGGLAPDPLPQLSDQEKLSLRGEMAAVGLVP